MHPSLSTTLVLTWLWDLWVATRFYVIDTHTLYHLLLGKFWIYKHIVVLFIYHHYLNAIRRARECMWMLMSPHPERWSLLLWGIFVWCISRRWRSRLLNHEVCLCRHGRTLWNKSQNLMKSFYICQSSSTFKADEVQWKEESEPEGQLLENQVGWWSNSLNNDYEARSFPKFWT